jgi:hypothetical protein
MRRSDRRIRYQRPLRNVAVDVRPGAAIVRPDAAAGLTPFQRIVAHELKHVAGATERPHPVFQ